MKPLFTFLFLAVATACLAQKKQNVYFLKDDGRYVDLLDSADFVRVVAEPDSGSLLYNVTEIYKNDKRKLAGRSSTIEPLTFEGTVISYSGNGTRKKVNNYKKGAYVGNQYEFYPNGKTYISLNYPDDGIRNSSVKEFSIIANYDSLGNALAQDGNGHFKFYDSKFNAVISEGDVKDGKKNGKITGIESGIRFTENYENGKLIDGTSTNKDGVVVNYKDVNATLPQFKGGSDAFGIYLSENIQYPYEERQNNIQGRVIVSFVVERDGSLVDYKILKSATKNFDQEALRVMKKSPKWKPGTMHGQLVRAQFTVPINFLTSPR